MIMNSYFLAKLRKQGLLTAQTVRAAKLNKDNEALIIHYLTHLEKLLHAHEDTGDVADEVEYLEVRGRLARMTVVFHMQLAAAQNAKAFAVEDGSDDDDDGFESRVHDVVDASLSTIRHPAVLAFPPRQLARIEEGVAVLLKDSMAKSRPGNDIAMAQERTFHLANGTADAVCTADNNSPPHAFLTQLNGSLGRLHDSGVGSPSYQDKATTTPLDEEFRGRTLHRFDETTVLAALRRPRSSDDKAYTRPHDRVDPMQRKRWAAEMRKSVAEQKRQLVLQWPSIASVEGRNGNVQQLFEMLTAGKPATMVDSGYVTASGSLTPES